MPRNMQVGTEQDAYYPTSCRESVHSRVESWFMAKKTVRTRMMTRNYGIVPMAVTVLQLALDDLTTYIPGVQGVVYTSDVADAIKHEVAIEVTVHIPAGNVKGNKYYWWWSTLCQRIVLENGMDKNSQVKTLDDLIRISNAYNDLCWEYSTHKQRSLDILAAFRAGTYTLDTYHKYSNYENRGPIMAWDYYIAAESRK